MVNCLVKPQEGFLVYWQHHKHLSVKGGVFLAIKKCRAVIVYQTVKRQSYAHPLTLLQLGGLVHHLLKSTGRTLLN